MRRRPPTAAAATKIDATWQPHGRRARPHFPHLVVDLSHNGELLARYHEISTVSPALAEENNFVWLATSPWRKIDAIVSPSLCGLSTMISAPWRRSFSLLAASRSEIVLASRGAPAKPPFACMQRINREKDRRHRAGIVADTMRWGGRATRAIFRRGGGLQKIC